MPLSAIGLLTDALRADGQRRTAMEGLCLPCHRVIVSAHGADIVPIPVDDEGLPVEAVIDADPDAVLVTQPAGGFEGGGGGVRARCSGRGRRGLSSRRRRTRAR